MAHGRSATELLLLFLGLLKGVEALVPIQHERPPSNSQSVTLRTNKRSITNDFRSAVEDYSTLSSTSSLLDSVLSHPSIAALDLEHRARRKLKPRHKALFRASSPSPSSGPTLFERLALACCDAGVSRKELFETYAAAVHVHEKFPHARRIADLAAGHGLLSWTLLALDAYAPDGSPVNDDDGRRRRTAVCVDRRMPPVATPLARAMRRDLFPCERVTDDLDDDDDLSLYDSRWTYVETDLNNVDAPEDGSALLVSVHACGTLTDKLIDMAISGNASSSSRSSAPLAFVPCCHTYSAKKGYAPHPQFSGTTTVAVAEDIKEKQRRQEEEDAAMKGDDGETKTVNRKFTIVENVIDEVRWRTLVNAGYDDVRIAALPVQFTERNRLFLVDGSDRGQTSTIVPSSSSTQSTSTTTINVRKGSMPPIVTDDEFVVPLNDDPQSIEACLSVSGRVRARQRIRSSMPDYFAPRLSVSLWLTPPPDPLTTVVDVDFEATLRSLQRVMDDTVASYRRTNNDPLPYACTVRSINGYFVQPATGRTSGTYEIEYAYCIKDGDADRIVLPFPKKTAKELHVLFRDALRTIKGTALKYNKDK